MDRTEKGELMIYLDNAATTSPIPLEDMYRDYEKDGWYNPSALYKGALDVEKELTKERDLLKKIINADNMIFTSCGTESANTIIFNGWKKEGGRKFHFITTMYEHACVYESFRELEAQGHEVTFLEPGRKGYISEEDLVKEIRDDTALIAIMHVNNETGAINDIAALSRAAKKVKKDVLFFSDGVQGYLKVPFDMRDSEVDYYTASAHKIHGLKGTGALFFRNGTPLKAYIHGGGQERNLRSGTENTFGIYAFYKAAKDFSEHFDEYTSHMRELRDHLDELLRKETDYVRVTPDNCAPHILNVYFKGMRGEVLLHLLEREGIYIATGSACSSKKGNSRVHGSIGLTREMSECVVRISFSHLNTLAETKETALKIHEALSKFQHFIRR